MITMPMMMKIKADITAQSNETLAKLKPTDQQGKIIMGVPRPKVAGVEINPPVGIRERVIVVRLLN